MATVAGCGGAVVSMSTGRKRIFQAWDALECDTCTVVDIGARDGADPRWRRLGNRLRLIGFEPDPGECRRLNTLATDAGTTFLTDALSDRSETVTLNVCRSPGTSSCYRPNLRFVQRFPDVARFDILAELHLNARTLDEALGGRDPIDFVKIDTQGSELRIIAGGHKRVAEAFGVEVEVEFSQLYDGQPLFADVDTALRGLGFILFDLRPAYWKRTTLPCRGSGQIVWADALYFKDPIATGVLPHNPSAAVAICLLYGKCDYAMELAEFFGASGAYTRDQYERLAPVLRQVASGSRLGNARGAGRLTNLLQLMVDRLREAHWPRYEVWKF